jgi:hypothetical protein
MVFIPRACMSNNSELLKKIPDAALREFAQLGAGSKNEPAIQSVILELKQPTRSVLARTPTLSAPQPAAKATAKHAKSSASNTDQADAMQRLQSYINDLGESAQSVSFPSSLLMGAMLAPEHLRELARWPEIAVIRPNRIHYVK